ncbi:hypothetical protein ACFSKW_29045 [Nonomuraea mangrovi]|uniref:Transposase n=1 Tax=Nonomuraea mangrovi TaxID=2316207 RepID=A0ABW4T0R2_9ACTN
MAVPDFLRQGWTGATPLALRTLQEAFARQLTPAERAAWIRGEEGRRQASVYLTRPRSLRNHTWEADHKQLPIVVLPPRGPALKPWLTTVVDDGTRALLGWTLAVTPHTGTVLTAFHMALVYDVERRSTTASPPAPALRTTATHTTGQADTDRTLRRQVRDLGALVQHRTSPPNAERPHPAAGLGGRPRRAGRAGCSGRRA